MRPIRYITKMVRLWEIDIILRIAYTATTHTKERIEKLLKKINNRLEHLDDD